MNILSLLRPSQYIKNFFIFLPLFFGLQITNIEALCNALIAFMAFSLAASSIYIINDYHDIEEDRRHPIKKHRPLAAETVSLKSAFTVMGVLLLGSVILMLSLSVEATLILAFYVLMNIAYSFYLKHIAILDVTIISIGFILRLFIGSSVTNIPLTMWIVVMTFLLALFIALAKRRDDVRLFLETGEKMRKVIDGYNVEFLDGAMMIMASVVIVSYILYTTSAEIIQKLHSDYLYLTSFFVIIGFMRYLQLAFVEKKGGNPTQIILKDKFMQLTVLGWLLSFTWILYL